MSNPHIQKLVSDFVSQVERLVHQQVVGSLQTALGAALGGAAAGGSKKIATTSRAAKPVKPVKSAKASRPTGKRTRTSPAEVAQNVGRLVAFIKANPGSTSEKTRAALGFEKNVWLKTLHQSVESKQLATKGQKRSTTLHPVKG